jgi:hypothetical protein
MRTVFSGHARTVRKVFCTSVNEHSRYDEGTMMLPILHRTARLTDSPREQIAPPTELPDLFYRLVWKSLSGYPLSVLMVG